MSNAFALIVEDDENLAEIFTLSLRSVNFETETVFDGDTALKRLAEVAPDVVILDLNLPHVSGREILNYIRSEERLATTKVMLATADALMAESLRQESDLVLLKPISPMQLRVLAERIITKRSVSE